MVNLIDFGQHISITFSCHQKTNMVLVLYTRCNVLERLELWEEINNIVDNSQCPWIVGGNFNVILNEKEKLGGLSFSTMKA